MELVTLNELLTDAQQKKYAVGAFNVFNLEGVKNILEAAEELESPVIIQAAMQEIEYSSGECLVGIVKSLALHKKVRIDNIVGLLAGIVDLQSVILEGIEPEFGPIGIDGIGFVVLFPTLIFVHWRRVILFRDPVVITVLIG